MNFKKSILTTLVLGTGVSTSALLTSFNVKLSYDEATQSSAALRCYTEGGTISVYDLKCSSCGYSSFKAKTASTCNAPTKPPVDPPIPL
ncbi:hypothetical protein GCM10009120_32320 [Sphingobacterium siyangense subsp. cladoniae]